MTAVMFEMSWIYDPTAWVGLLALVVIQIVLGIDNLVFIAVLSAKLPPSQRPKARYIGIGGALVIRLILLALLAYVVAISKPLFSIGSFDVSVHDLVLFIGGIFLFYKSVEELHSKLEGDETEDLAASKAGGHSLMLVATQIMVLDALFSVDAIVTAVGMTNQVYIMMIAVILAMTVMLWASGFVTEFVARHPTLVILCLGFLLMIAFSLLMEAFHYEVPKGYLYAAIGFSLLIEILNQVMRRNTLNLNTRSMQSRELAANLVLRLLGSKKSEVQSLKEAIVSPNSLAVFDNQEQEMVARVLQLSSLPVKAVMTARNDLQMLKLDAPLERVVTKAQSASRSKLVAYRSGFKDQPLGIIHRASVLALAVEDKADEKHLLNAVVEPLFIPETVSILKALEQFRTSKNYTAFVYDEFGNFEGLVTLHDIMEEVAGELPDQTEIPEIIKMASGIWRVDGEAILKDVERITGFSVPPSEHYQTLAGFILDYLQRLPEKGEILDIGTWRLEILLKDTTSIEAVKLTSLKKAKTGK